MATHSSVLAWRIPGTGEPVGLPSMGSHRVGHVQAWAQSTCPELSAQGLVPLRWVGGGHQWALGLGKGSPPRVGMKVKSLSRVGLCANP